MANTAPKKHDASFTLRVDPEFKRMLDDLLLYEAQQRNRMTKSDMIRSLVKEAWLAEQRLRK